MIGYENDPTNGQKPKRKETGQHYRGGYIDEGIFGGYVWLLGTTGGKGKTFEDCQFAIDKILDK